MAGWIQSNPQISLKFMFAEKKQCLDVIETVDDFRGFYRTGLFVGEHLSNHFRHDFFGGLGGINHTIVFKIGNQADQSLPVVQVFMRNEQIIDIADVAWGQLISPAIQHDYFPACFKFVSSDFSFRIGSDSVRY